MLSIAGKSLSKNTSQILLKAHYLSSKLLTRNYSALTYLINFFIRKPDLNLINKIKGDRSISENNMGATIA